MKQKTAAVVWVLIASISWAFAVLTMPSELMNTPAIPQQHQAVVTFLLGIVLFFLSTSLLAGWPLRGSMR